MMKIFLTLYLLLLSITTLGDIKKQDLLRLEKGEQVLSTKKVNANPWPRIRIYQLVDASPLETLAIFLALDHQKNYLPNVKESDPVKHVSPTEVYTSYELELPWPLSNSHYTHASDFKKVSENEYTAKWWMITSESAESVEGSARFSSYKGKTIMEYNSLVKPKSFLAGLVKDTMLEDTQASIEAVRTELARLKKEDTKLLEKYKKIITESLNGLNVYGEVIKSHSSKK